MLLNSFLSAHIPPSVVLLRTHVVIGDDPTSLLQETLMLYHVSACSPGTSEWKGGVVTLMSRVTVTSPFLWLTSLTWKKGRAFSGFRFPGKCSGQHGPGQIFTLIWHNVRGEKPSCPGLQLSINLLGCVSVTTTSDTGFGATGKHRKNPS